MTTRNEAYAACVKRGDLRPAECAAWADDRSIAGEFCDGDIVLSINGSRCVPSAVVERVIDARRASPPATSSPSSAAPSIALPLLALAGVGLVVYLATR